MSVTYDIRLKRNSVWSRTFQYLDVDGVAKVVTGWKALLQVRVEEGTDVLLELTEIDGITIDEATATFEVIITQTAANTVAEGTYQYDLLAWDPLDPDNTAVYLAEGTFYTVQAISVVVVP